MNLNSTAIDARWFSLIQSFVLSVSHISLHIILNSVCVVFFFLKIYTGNTSYLSHNKN